jgi:rhodanese-related sulfurtransferase
MPSHPITLKPSHVAELLETGRAVLVDIREPDEFARRRVKGAVSRPLSTLGPHLGLEGDSQIIFACRSGMRTAAHCARLADLAGGEALILGGGLDGWSAEGLPVEVIASAPLEIMRQVQITAGLIILLGVLLGYTVNPALFLLSGLIGAGLTFAGATGYCGLARLLKLAPWNRALATSG